MAATTVLMAAQAESLRRVLLGLAIAAGLIAGLYILSSQAAADFLKEGAARSLSADGDALRVILGGGAAIATAIAGAALWRGVTIAGVVVAAIALAVGFLLVHIMLMPAIALFALAVVADRSGHVTRERIAEVGPRRYPLFWAAGGVVAAVGLVVMTGVTLYLAEPLFDEGTRLDEGLGFQVAGLVQPTAMAGADDAGAAATSTPTAMPAGAASGADGGDEMPQGELIAMGELMGVDAFHTGSGQVLLVRAPDGSLVLRFQDYEVRNGPGLYIYLTPDPDGDVHADGAIELEKIKATSGFVNYDIPSDVDPSIFRTAVIYCKPFGVVFATAVFE